MTGKEGECTNRENVDQVLTSMTEKKETNLVVTIVKVKAGTWKLGLDDVPKPVHWRTKRDVRGIGWSRATSEEGHELAEGVYDDGARVPAPGEQTGVVLRGERTGFVLIRVDCYFHRIAAA